MSQRLTLLRCVREAGILRQMHEGIHRMHGIYGALNASLALFGLLGEEEFNARGHWNDVGRCVHNMRQLAVGGDTLPADSETNFTYEDVRTM